MTRSGLFIVFVVLFAAGLFNLASGDDFTWLPFRTGNAEGEPEITMLESNDDYVLYRIVTPGVWWKDVIGTDLETYQKLTLFREQNRTEDGYPMLPRVPVNLAIPTGSTVSVTVTTVSQLSLSGYNTAPYPILCGQIEYGMQVMDEIFTPNVSIYSLTSIYLSATT